MAITINKKNIQKNVARLSTTPKRIEEQYLHDYVIDGIKVKNVPFLKNKNSFTDPYVLSGKTMNRVFTLILENERNGYNRKIIEFN